MAPFLGDNQKLRGKPAAPSLVGNTMWGGKPAKEPSLGEKMKLRPKPVDLTSEPSLVNLMRRMPAEPSLADPTKLIGHSEQTLLSAAPSFADQAKLRGHSGQAVFSAAPSFADQAKLRGHSGQTLFSAVPSFADQAKLRGHSGQTVFSAVPSFVYPTRRKPVAAPSYVDPSNLRVQLAYSADPSPGEKTKQRGKLEDYAAEPSFVKKTRLKRQPFAAVVQ